MKACRDLRRSCLAIENHADMIVYLKIVLNCWSRGLDPAQDPSQTSPKTPRELTQEEVLSGFFFFFFCLFFSNFCFYS